MFRVFMFGHSEFFLDDRRLDNFASPHARLIFAYMLLLPGRMHDRSYLAAQFWGELSDTRARRILNTELWRICNALKKFGIDPDDLLNRTHDVIGIKHDACYWCDAVAFKRTLQDLEHRSPENCEQHHIDAYESATNLYRGDLLEGEVEDWCLIQRESFLDQQTRALEFMLGYHLHREQWHIALRYAQRVLQLDSLMEHIHRALMQCHYMIGNRPAAINQYLECRSILQRELSVPPMAITEQLYIEIVGLNKEKIVNQV